MNGGAEGADQNPAVQFAASEADALRALAGPGTGKTYAMVQRVAQLIESGEDPSRLLIVTFARTAARDLVGAVAELEAAAGELVPRTLHSFCFSLLNRERVLQATGRHPRILLDFERDLLLQDLEGDFGGLRERRKLVLAFEAAWARQQADEPGEPVPGLDQEFQNALRASLRWHRAMLVGEVVPIALSYLRNNPQADELAAYDHVLVDEYQDLNRAEQEVLNLLSSRSNLAVIGDDDQSIYSFKQANPEGIREFHLEHDPTEDVEFRICRRCPSLVVDMAQQLIQRNPGRARLPLVPLEGNPEGEIHHVQWAAVEEEAEGIAQFIERKIEDGIPAGRCLVLTNRRLIGYMLRDAIAERGIECSSYFREEAVGTEKAQEALTLLTLLADPEDRVALRSWLSFGVTTDRRAAYLRLSRAAREEDVDVGEILQRLDREDIAIPYTRSAVDRWRELQVRLDDLRGLELEGLVESLFPPDEEDLELLFEAAMTALEEVEDLPGLADAVRYGVSQRETPLEAEEVRVMSLHASKGLTADLVVIAGAVDGVIPTLDSDQSVDQQEIELQEQRRLFFVGITRTTNILVLSSYSELPDSLVHRIRARVGRRMGRAFRTFGSSFIDELGQAVPTAVRGQDWNY
jgi:DNA helicase-2/ATP-dependent DNA helicase PcrA